MSLIFYWYYLHIKVVLFKKCMLNIQLYDCSTFLKHVVLIWSCGNYKNMYYVQKCLIILDTFGVTRLIFCKFRLNCLLFVRNECDCMHVSWGNLIWSPMLLITWIDGPYCLCFILSLSSFSFYPALFLFLLHSFCPLTYLVCRWDRINGKLHSDLQNFRLFCPFHLFHCFLSVFPIVLLHRLRVTLKQNRKYHLCVD